MADDKPLNDVEVWDALHEAIQTLEGRTGETVRGETALRTARETLKMIQMGHLAAMDSGNDNNVAIRDPGET